MDSAGALVASHSETKKRDFQCGTACTRTLTFENFLSIQIGGLLGSFSSRFKSRLANAV